MVRFTYTNHTALTDDFELLCSKGISAHIKQPSAIEVQASDETAALKVLTASRHPRYRAAVISSERIGIKFCEHGVPLDKQCIGCMDLFGERAENGR